MSNLAGSGILAALAVHENHALGNDGGVQILMSDPTEVQVGSVLLSSQVVHSLAALRDVTPETFMQRLRTETAPALPRRLRTDFLQALEALEALHQGDEDAMAQLIADEAPGLNSVTLKFSRGLLVLLSAQLGVPLLSVIDSLRRALIAEDSAEPATISHPDHK